MHLITGWAKQAHALRMAKATSTDTHNKLYCAPEHRSNISNIAHKHLYIPPFASFPHEILPPPPAPREPCTTYLTIQSCRTPPRSQATYHRHSCRACTRCSRGTPRAARGTRGRQPLRDNSTQVSSGSQQAADGTREREKSESGKTTERASEREPKTHTPALRSWLGAA